jgi:high affinity Mn2+ porin
MDARPIGNGCRAVVARAFLWGTVAFTVCGRATAGDFPAAVPVKAPPPQASYDWTGAYVGGHFGYSGGSLGPGTNPILDEGVIFPPTITGLVGGYQAGWNVQLSDHLVLGVEVDATFTSPIDRGVTNFAAPFNTKLDYIGTARPRVGYAFGTLFPYLTGGLAWGQTTVEINNNAGGIASNSAMLVGWTVGTGVAFPLAGKWTGKIEYNYVDLASAGTTSPSVMVNPKIHLLKIGLNYRICDALPWPGSNAAFTGRTSVPETSDFQVHGQTTFIEQGYPRFHSPYQGQNSLPGGGQGRETWTTTALIGWRPWEGGELYFNPEIDQGFGLAGTLGLAGFPNGEAQKAGSQFPKFRPQRYFFRQTIGLGGEQETVEDGANQLPGKRDINRITITVGRIAVGDIFDTNAYAHDPRADFMNWALWEAAAYDFPADLPGFTRGAVVELNRKDWALRAGVFQVPQEPNSDVLVFKTGGAIVELEDRYTIFDHAGKLRLGAFANRGRTGNYNEALAIAAADPSIDINSAMLLTRAQRFKSGLYANLEQAINKDVGVFARASWNDGQNEILSFTEIDWSLSGGVSVKGNKWGRSDDTFGFGGAIDGLSGPHRAFLAAGGLGLIIGDGKLNYRKEKVLETYYAYKIDKSTTLTFDYQFFVNPADNADRGPVSVFAARLHAEF